MTSREVLSVRWIHFFRRTGMILLFLGAIYTTFSAISNLTIADIHTWLKQEKRVSALNVDDHVKSREVALKKKQLNTVKQQTRYISSEQVEGPETLEEAINL